MKQKFVKRYYKVCLAFSLLFTILERAVALNVPSLAGTPLHDKAGILSNKQKNTLESQLLSIDSRGAFQAGVLIIKNLEGNDIESYAVKVFEKWKLGKKGKDTGVLIVVAINDHKMRIEVGYGLEGDLTDAKCGIIIRNIMAPHFKNDNYFEGLSKAISAIENEIEGDGSTIKTAKKSNEFQDTFQDTFQDNMSMIIYIIVAFIIIILQIRRFFKPDYDSRGFRWFGGFGGFGGDNGGFSGDGGTSGGGGASGDW